MIVILAIPLLLYPTKGQAFLDSGTIFWPVKVGIDVTNKVAVWVEKVLGKAGAIAYKNGLSYFLSKIAEDTAVYLASGDKGQKPMFITEGWGKYLENVGDEAMGMFMYDVFNTKAEGYCSVDKTTKCKRDSDCTDAGAQEYMDYDDVFDELDMEDQQYLLDSATTGKNYCVIKGKTGVNVCTPKSLSTRLTIQYSITQSKTSSYRQPKCSWTEMKENWETEINDPNFLRNFSASLQPKQSDIGIWLTLRTGLDDTINNAAEKAVKERQDADGFKAVTDLIGENVKTPAIMISKTAQQTIEERAKKESTYTGEVWADAVGIFTNTLANKLMNKWIKRGMYTLNDLGKNKGGFGGLQFTDVGSGLTPQQAARDFYADLGKPNYASGGSVGITTMLSSDCSTDPDFGSEQFCGIIDNNFATAIEQRMTVEQAVKQGMIKGNRPFGFLDGQTEPSYRDGIPYRSILVLRKYRVVPVGWELAAQYIRDFGKEEVAETQSNGQGGVLSLNYLLDNYNNPDSPFYKLVDPGWQLKAPETICYREGPGPDIIDEQIQCRSGEEIKDCAKEDILVYLTRRTYCADERSCIIESSDGRSCDFYGYCVEEKPIWRLKGDQCYPYYNTCQTFNTDKGKVTYLENTLTSCDTVNCSAYCDILDPENEEWKCDDLTTYPDAIIKYYSSNETCDASEQGCTQFKRVLHNDQTTPLTKEEATEAVKDDPSEYLEYDIALKIAPKYSEDKYSCDGYTTLLDQYTDNDTCTTAGKYWRNDFNICVQSGNQFCEDFATQCSDSDVSCRLYTPISLNAPAVSAVITPRECPNGGSNCSDDTANISWNDECPGVCSGFRGYTQQITQFEKTPDPEWFIASTAKKCSQPGCDEFTNLDEVAQGGDGIEYYSYLRLCADPDDATVETFYTWEGSDTEGYQLKKWELKTAGNRPEGESCDIEDKTVDCREFYNPEDQVYYPVKFDSVIFGIDDCHPFRRTLDGETYHGTPSYSTTCSSSNAGCRAYRDNSSYNYEVVLDDDFEDNNADGWIYSDKSVPEISRESVKRAGHSMKITQATEYLLPSGSLVEGDSYSITFVAKGNGGIELSLSSDNGGFIKSKELLLESTWKLNTVIFEDALPEGEYSDPKLIIRPTNTYIDYIVIKRINNTLVIKDSWEHDQSCDGLNISWCDAFVDNLGKQWTLQNFSNLCLEDVVGCEAMIGLDDSGNKEWQYYVYDEDKICTDIGCTRLGKVSSDKFYPENASLFNFVDKYIIVKDGDKCTEKDDRCLEFVDDEENGSPYRYKDPRNRKCEFNDGEWWVVGEDHVYCPRTEEGVCSNALTSTCTSNVDCVVAGVSGTCIKETVDIIGAQRNSEKHCLGGRKNDSDPGGNNICTDDSECLDYYTFDQKVDGICTSWVGACLQSDSGCEEYQDPFEPKYCDIDLLPYQTSGASRIYGGSGGSSACNYYWYKNIDESCNGADPNNGCVEFVNTSETLSR